MVGAVEQPHAHALDRIAGEHARLHRLAHALLDRRDERARDHAALDLVDELEALADRQRLDLDVAVAELTATARLLLVAPVRARATADRLLVGHARRLERDLDAEAIAKPVDDHFDVHLGEPGHDLLAGLLVAMQVDRRVLLLQATQRGEHLLLVAPALRLDRERHHRRGQLQARHLDRLVARRKPVARAGLLELGHRADVAGPELLHVDGLLAREHDQLADPLLDVGARVEHLAVGRHHALVDAQQVDPPGERVGARLEDVGEQLALLRRLELDLADAQRPVLDRRGQVLDDRVEQARGAEVAGRHAAHDREDLAVVGALLERVHDLLVGDLVTLQVALHQRVGDFADLVHQLLAVLLRLLRLLLGDRDLAPVAALRGVLAEGLHVDEVDHALEIVLGADRDLGGDDVRSEGPLELLERAEEVGALAVEHVHEQHPRDVELGGARPQARGGDLDAHHRVDDEHRRLAHAQRAQRVGDEARLAGRVEQVDLALSPLKRAERGRDRHLPRLLVGVGVRDRRSVGHRAQAVGRAGLEQQRLVQRGLARAAMADQGDVANPVRCWAITDRSHAISFWLCEHHTAVACSRQSPRASRGNPRRGGAARARRRPSPRDAAEHDRKRRRQPAGEGRPVRRALDGQRRMLARIMDEVTADAGEVIMSEGDPGYEALVIEEGTADVLRGDTLINTMGPGDMFGELAVLGDGAPRTASVVASSSLRAVVLTAHFMREVHDRVPAVGERSERIAAERRERDAARSA